MLTLKTPSDFGETMGLFGKQEQLDAVESFTRAQERFVASVHEEYDVAVSLLSRAKVTAAAKASELTELAAAAKNAARYLKDTFDSE